MAINHELSSDIAVALLTGEVVLKVHAEFQKLEAESHRPRTIARAAGDSGKEI